MHGDPLKLGLNPSGENTARQLVLRVSRVTVQFKELLNAIQGSVRAVDFNVMR
jgi:hypothetical protein